MEKDQGESEETKENKDNSEANKRVSELGKKIKKNPWMVVSAVLAIIVIVLLILNFTGITGNVISEGDASDKLLEYLNSRTGGGVELIEVEDNGNLYAVLVKYQGQEIPVYITKDGEYFVQGVMPLVTGQATQTQPQQQEITKSDNPKVELFVMTHCPYGTQAEKGMVPVINALGGDITIRFVHYFMHGDVEEQESYRQLCIREEQEDKYIDYLTCFLEDGDHERCLGEVGINKAKLNTCMSTKAEDYYAQDSELSESYGVQGSPTLVINGQIVSGGRSPAAYLDTICSAYSEAPEQCDMELSSETPGAMWGWGESGQDTAAQC